jgi:sensor domain CHASE-containing protein
MGELVHELNQMETQEWVHLLVVIFVLIIGVVVVLIVLIWGLRQLRISFGKDGLKLNESANNKLDIILARLQKLEKDVVALQIMNEHITPEEQLKLYDYYKQELKGNSFIDEYIKVVKTKIDKSKFE